MLFLLQAAAQHLPPGLPPINVTVQQPAGGMPEWIKITISAAVGAAFGIGANVLMEFVKPAIAKHQMLRLVTDQLVNEAMHGMLAIQECLVYLEDAAKNAGEQRRMAMMTAARHLQERTPLLNDRYTFYFDQQKAVVYEIDDRGLLAEFYQYAESFRAFTSQGSLIEAKSTGERAVEVAGRFFESKKLGFLAKVSGLKY
jgi:hypothetical protein